MVNALIGPITSSAPLHLDFLLRRCHTSFAPSRSYAAISTELTMATASSAATGPARVAVAQMTSINDLAANFATCLASSRESKIWLSLGGFQEIGSDNAHLCNTRVVIDDAGIIKSTYRKIPVENDLLHTFLSFFAYPLI